MGPGVGRRRQERGLHSRRQGLSGCPQRQLRWLGHGEDWTGGRAGSECHLSRAWGYQVRVLGQEGLFSTGRQGVGETGDQVAVLKVVKCALGPRQTGQSGRCLSKGAHRARASSGCQQSHVCSVETLVRGPALPPGSADSLVLLALLFLFCLCSSLSPVSLSPSLLTNALNRAGLRSVL